MIKYKRPGNWYRSLLGCITKISLLGGHKGLKVSFEDGESDLSCGLKTSFSAPNLIMS